jgi:ribosomal protein L24
MAKNGNAALEYGSMVKVMINQGPWKGQKARVVNIVDYGQILVMLDDHSKVRVAINHVEILKPEPVVLPSRIIGEIAVGNPYTEVR